MTPYSLNSPAPFFQAQTQLFISPNNQDSRTFFKIFDPRPTIEIGGFRDNDQLQDEKMVLHDDGSSSNCNSSLVSAEGVKDDGSKECEEEDGKNNHGSGKWVSSKMRVMKKMMMRRSMSMSPTTDKGIISSPRFQNQRLESRYSQTSPRNNNSSSITRVCSDCNTSTTPLWRSGPKGPKSLCNACGIRQRKARRAMAEAANGLVSPINNEGFVKNRVPKKEKKYRANHVAQFRNKFKSTATTTTATAGSSEGVRKLEYFKDFSISLRSNSSFQQVFPRDEVAEAALLLMDLSCGFVHF